MKYLTIFVVILISLLPSVVRAQDWLDQYPSRNSYGRNNLNIADIKGSPYLDNEYKMGTVLTTDDVLYKDIPLRYNCFDDVLEFKKNDVSLELKPKELVKRAEFGGQVFSYRDYESNSGVAKGYFEILVDGKATLSRRFTIKFYEPEPIKAYADPVPARFDDFDERFFVSVNNTPAKVIVNIKKLVEILGDKQKEVETFISKQKLSVKKAEDLKKIITYYNAL